MPIRLKLTLKFINACALVLLSISSGTFAMQLARLAPPANVRVEAGRNAINVRWDASADEANYNLAGYNVYFDDKSIASSKPNQLPAAIQVVKGKKEWVVRGLENGRKYFLQVRSRNNAGDVSAPSLPEKEAVPQFEAKQYALTMYDDDRSTPAYNSGYGWNYKNGQAQPGFHDLRQHGKYVDILMIASPTKNQHSIFISPADTEHTQRWPIRNRTLIADVGMDLLTTAIPPDSVFTAQAEIKIGHVYVLKTSADYYLKLRVDACTEVKLLLPWGEQPQSTSLNKITFTYVAQLGQSYEQFLMGKL